MYIRKTTKKHKDKTYTNYLLVESINTPKGPRQKTICSLGDLSPRSRQEWLQLARKMAAALAGQTEILGMEAELEEVIRKVKATAGRRRKPRSDDEVLAVRLKEVETARHREAGPVHVGYQFWRRLGCEEILAQVGLGARARILTAAMVLNRLVSPCSEHAMPRWLGSAALGDILGVDLETVGEDSLYRNLTQLPHF